MATLTKTRELKGAFEDVRDVVLREGGKGPIINAMIEMDGAEMSVPAIVVASKWMTDEELDVFAELLIEEGGYVAWNCADEWMIGATAFLRRYGLLKESRGMFDEWGACYDIQGLTPKAAILKVTKDYPSGGGMDWGDRRMYGILVEQGSG